VSRRVGQALSSPSLGNTRLLEMHSRSVVADAEKSSAKIRNLGNHFVGPWGEVCGLTD
jgi:hypothetical protein